MKLFHWKMSHGEVSITKVIRYIIIYAIDISTFLARHYALIIWCCSLFVFISQFKDAHNIRPP